MKRNWVKFCEHTIQNDWDPKTVGTKLRPERGHTRFGSVPVVRCTNNGKGVRYLRLNAAGKWVECKRRARSLSPTRYFPFLPHRARLAGDSHRHEAVATPGGCDTHILDHMRCTCAACMDFACRWRRSLKDNFRSRVCQGRGRVSQYKPRRWTHKIGPHARRSNCPKVYSETACVDSGEDDACIKYPFVGSPQVNWWYGNYVPCSDTATNSSSSSGDSQPCSDHSSDSDDVVLEPPPTRGATKGGGSNLGSKRSCVKVASAEKCRGRAKAGPTNERTKCEENSVSSRSSSRRPVPLGSTSGGKTCANFGRGRVKVTIKNSVRPPDVCLSSRSRGSICGSRSGECAVTGFEQTAMSGTMSQGALEDHFTSVTCTDPASRMLGPRGLVDCNDGANEARVCADHSPASDSDSDHDRSRDTSPERENEENVCSDSSGECEERDRSENRRDLDDEFWRKGKVWKPRKSPKKIMASRKYVPEVLKKNIEDILLRDNHKKPQRKEVVNAKRSKYGPKSCRVRKPRSCDQHPVKFGTSDHNMARRWSTETVSETTRYLQKYGTVGGGVFRGDYCLQKDEGGFYHLSQGTPSTCLPVTQHSDRKFGGYKSNFLKHMGWDGWETGCDGDGEQENDVITGWEDKDRPRGWRHRGRPGAYHPEGEPRPVETEGTHGWGSQRSTCAGGRSRQRVAGRERRGKRVGGRYEYRSPSRSQESHCMDGLSNSCQSGSFLREEATHRGKCKFLADLVSPRKIKYAQMESAASPKTLIQMDKNSSKHPDRERHDNSETIKDPSEGEDDDEKNDGLSKDKPGKHEPQRPAVRQRSPPPSSSDVSRRDLHSKGESTEAASWSPSLSSGELDKDCVLWGPWRCNPSPRTAGESRRGGRSAERKRSVHATLDARDKRKGHCAQRDRAADRTDDARGMDVPVSRAVMDQDYVFHSPWTNTLDKWIRECRAIRSRRKAAEREEQQCHYDKLLPDGHDYVNAAKTDPNCETSSAGGCDPKLGIRFILEEISGDGGSRNDDDKEKGEQPDITKTSSKTGMLRQTVEPLDETKNCHALNESKSRRSKKSGRESENTGGRGIQSKQIKIRTVHKKPHRSNTSMKAESSRGMNGVKTKNSGYSVWFENESSLSDPRSKSSRSIDREASTPHVMDKRTRSNRSFHSESNDLLRENSESNTSLDRGRKSNRTLDTRAGSSRSIERTPERSRYLGERSESKRSVDKRLGSDRSLHGDTPRKIEDLGAERPDDYYSTVSVDKSGRSKSWLSRRVESILSGLTTKSNSATASVSKGRSYASSGPQTPASKKQSVLPSPKHSSATSRAYYDGSRDYRSPESSCSDDSYPDSLDNFDSDKPVETINILGPLKPDQTRRPLVEINFYGPLEDCIDDEPEQNPKLQATKSTPSRLAPSAIRSEGRSHKSTTSLNSSFPQSQQSKSGMLSPDLSPRSRSRSPSPRSGGSPEPRHATSAQSSSSQKRVSRKQENNRKKCIKKCKEDCDECCLELCRDGGYACENSDTLSDETYHLCEKCSSALDASTNHPGGHTLNNSSDQNNRRLIKFDVGDAHVNSYLNSAGGDHYKCPDKKKSVSRNDGDESKQTYYEDGDKIPKHQRAAYAGHVSRSTLSRSRTSKEGFSFSPPRKNALAIPAVRSPMKCTPHNTNMKTEPSVAPNKQHTISEQCNHELRPMIAQTERFTRFSTEQRHGSSPLAKKSDAKDSSKFRVIDEENPLKLRLKQQDGHAPVVPQEVRVCVKSRARIRSRSLSASKRTTKGKPKVKSSCYPYFVLDPLTRVSKDTAGQANKQANPLKKDRSRSRSRSSSVVKDVKEQKVHPTSEKSSCLKRGSKYPETIWHKFVRAERENQNWSNRINGVKDPSVRDSSLKRSESREKSGLSPTTTPDDNGIEKYPPSAQSLPSPTASDMHPGKIVKVRHGRLTTKQTSATRKRSKTSKKDQGQACGDGEKSWEPRINGWLTCSHGAPRSTHLNGSSNWSQCCSDGEHDTDVSAGRPDYNIWRHFSVERPRPVVGRRVHYADEMPRVSSAQTVRVVDEPVPGENFSSPRSRYEPWCRRMMGLDAVRHDGRHGDKTTPRRRRRMRSGHGLGRTGSDANTIRSARDRDCAPGGLTPDGGYCLSPTTRHGRSSPLASYTPGYCETRPSRSCMHEDVTRGPPTLLRDVPPAQCDTRQSGDAGRAHVDEEEDHLRQPWQGKAAFRASRRVLEEPAPKTQPQWQHRHASLMGDCNQERMDNSWRRVHRIRDKAKHMEGSMSQLKLNLGDIETRLDKVKIMQDNYLDKAEQAVEIARTEQYDPRYTEVDRSCNNSAHYDSLRDSRHRRQPRAKKGRNWDRPLTARTGEKERASGGEHCRPRSACVPPYADQPTDWMSTDEESGAYNKQIRAYYGDYLAARASSRNVVCPEASEESETSCRQSWPLSNPYFRTIPKYRRHSDKDYGLDHHDQNRENQRRREARLSTGTCRRQNRQKENLGPVEDGCNFGKPKAGSQLSRFKLDGYGGNMPLKQDTFSTPRMEYTAIIDKSSNNSNSKGVVRLSCSQMSDPYRPSGSDTCSSGRGSLLSRKGDNACRGENSTVASDGTNQGENESPTFPSWGDSLKRESGYESDLAAPDDTNPDHQRLDLESLRDTLRKYVARKSHRSRLTSGGWLSRVYGPTKTSDCCGSKRQHRTPSKVPRPANKASSKVSHGNSGRHQFLRREPTRGKAVTRQAPHKRGGGLVRRWTMCSKIAMCGSVYKHSPSKRHRRRHRPHGLKYWLSKAETCTSSRSNGSVDPTGIISPVTQVSRANHVANDPSCLNSEYTESEESSNEQCGAKDMQDVSTALLQCQQSMVPSQPLTPAQTLLKIRQDYPKDGGDMAHNDIVQDHKELNNVSPGKTCEPPMASQNKGRDTLAKSRYHHHHSSRSCSPERSSATSPSPPPTSPSSSYSPDPSPQNIVRHTNPVNPPPAVQRPCQCSCQTSHSATTKHLGHVIRSDNPRHAHQRCRSRIGSRPPDGCGGDTCDAKPCLHGQDGGKVTANQLSPLLKARCDDANWQDTRHNVDPSSGPHESNLVAVQLDKARHDKDKKIRRATINKGLPCDLYRDRRVGESVTTGAYEEHHNDRCRSSCGTSHGTSTIIRHERRKHKAAPSCCPSGIRVDDRCHCQERLPGRTVLDIYNPGTLSLANVVGNPFLPPCPRCRTPNGPLGPTPRWKDAAPRVRNVQCLSANDLIPIVVSDRTLNVKPFVEDARRKPACGGNSHVQRKNESTVYVRYEQYKNVGYSSRHRRVDPLKEAIASKWTPWSSYHQADIRKRAHVEQIYD